MTKQIKYLGFVWWLAELDEECKRVLTIKDQPFKQEGKCK